MDQETLSYYNSQASAYAKNAESQPMPKVIQDFACVYFRKGFPTADIGCAGGRDAAWLQKSGYQTKGYDASEELLKEARSRHHHLNFQSTTLPSLSGIGDGAYHNVLCSGVLMHLATHDIVTACINLLRITSNDGMLILSIRASRERSEREHDGRLFTVINPSQLSLILGSLGGEVLWTSDSADEHREGIVWSTLVIQKSSTGRARGLYRLQEIVTRDQKTTTYKFALIRALCAVAKFETESVRWAKDGQGHDAVLIPLRSLAVWWLKFYWPLIIESNVPQIRGQNPLAFFKLMRKVGQQQKYGPTREGLALVINDIESGIAIPGCDSLLIKIAETMVKGPIKHAGGEHNPLFGVVLKLHTGDLGHLKVPVETWRDIALFGHWIDESIIVQWAKWTQSCNDAARTQGNKGPHLKLGDYIEMLSAPISPKRTTDIIRKFVSDRLENHRDMPHHCVRSGERLRGDFQIDHVIPYSVWSNNDLWNLLPTIPKINRLKTDKIPSYKLIARQSNLIVEYWQFYQYEWPVFTCQLRRSLRSTGTDEQLLKLAINGLLEVAERLACTMGLERFDTNRSS